MVDILQNFVAFSEHLNFNSRDRVREGTVLMQKAGTTDGLHDKCHESIILIK